MRRQLDKDAEYIYRVLEETDYGTIPNGPYGAPNAAKGIFTRLLQDALRRRSYRNTDVTLTLQRSPVVWETVEVRHVSKEEKTDD